MSDAATVIRGGLVVDGTGTPGVERDLVLVDGRVTADSDAPPDAVELDATGCVVAPGFIDIHTHYDAQVFWDPALSPSCFHGVTTVVTGNCGFSIAPTRPEHHDVIARTLENVEDMDFETLKEGIPWDFQTFGEYLESVERRGMALNYSAFVGHTALRLFVMGDDAYHREASDGEIGEMQRVLGESLRAGAAGLATSFADTHRGLDGMPIPSRRATKAEFRALLDVVSDWGRGVVEVTFGDQLPIKDLYELQPQVGVPFTYAALLTFPSGIHHKRLDLHAQAVAAGVDVWPQVSPRPLTFAFRMDDPFPLNASEAFGELMSGDLENRRRAYADPAWREHARVSIERMRTLEPRWESYTIGGAGDVPEIPGRPLTEIAAERGVTPFDALLDIAANEVTTWVRAVAANDDEEGVARLLQAEHCALGLSDAGAHVGQLCDAPQATDLLGRWVRDKGVMSIEEAIRRLTSAQADLFGFEDRGRLTPGSAADVVVFDPSTVGPGPITRVRDFPANSQRLTAAEPTGVRHVLVNGVPIRVDEVQVDDADTRPGRLVRPGAR